MSVALRLPPAISSSLQQRQRQRLRRRGSSSPSSSSSSSSCLLFNRTVCSRSFRGKTAAVAASSSWRSVEEGVPPKEENDDHHHLGDAGGGDVPASIELETVVGEEQFDRIVAEAQQLEVPVVVVWMANWCRKCIYLKPKLGKLAMDYYPRIRFYCVDVNSVPHRLVKHAGVTKMPTIQLWKDSKKQAELIGGHKAWLVVNDVRQMIENEC